SGAKENVFEPDYSGKFAVRISNDMGCSQVSGCYDVIASGLIATDMENALEVMPNPTKGLITIFNKTGLKIESVDLYSMSGQSMKKYYLDKDNSFDISGYSEGIYLIRIAINNKIIVRRIILIK
ncbi:MAG TPA: T9SS type A sorting domain-containing protein, partial [Bacteroidetes bacterium]|nr:T9SS type A sorting domain-containing protein [Bacteroidota bacterium]